jgi:hypothetical protein
MKETKVEEGTGGAPTLSTYGRRGFEPKAKLVSAPLKFEGRCDGFNGFVFDCADGKHSDIYNVDMKELVEYVGRDYTYGGDIHWTMENELMLTVPMPRDPATDDNATAKHIWGHRIDE